MKENISFLFISFSITNGTINLPTTLHINTNAGCYEILGKTASFSVSIFIECEKNAKTVFFDFKEKDWAKFRSYFKKK